MLLVLKLLVSRKILAAIAELSDLPEGCLFLYHCEIVPSSRSDKCVDVVSIMQRTEAVDYAAG